MTDSYLFVVGCGVFALFIGGAYVVMRERFLGIENAAPQREPLLEREGVLDIENAAPELSEPISVQHGS